LPIADMATVTPSTKHRPSHSATHTATTPSVTGTCHHVDVLRSGGQDRPDRRTCFDRHARRDRPPGRARPDQSAWRGWPGLTSGGSNAAPAATSARPLATGQGTCSANWSRPGSAPAPSPAVGAPARGCDFDHTIPWDQHGRTCECNLAALCRRHHQVKQAPGWHLTQPAPGLLTWTAPHGRSYTVTPDPYPV